MVQGREESQRKDRSPSGPCVIAMPSVIRSRWSASTVMHHQWPSAFKAAQRDLQLRGFDLTVWRKPSGVFGTVGERIRPGITPELSEDGVEFSCIWLHAATAEEVSCFWRGMLAGEALVRLRG